MMARNSVPKKEKILRYEKGDLIHPCEIKDRSVPHNQHWQATWKDFIVFEMWRRR